MEQAKIVLIILSILGGISSSPPLREVSPEFENFEEIIPLYKLPDSLVPSYYNVELQPILDEGYGTRFTAPGKVSINVLCLFATNNITLHALTLNISESSVQVREIVGGSEIPIASFDVDAEKDFFIINLQNGLRAGAVYQIYIEFVAPVSREVLYGLYLSNYTADDGSTRYMAITDLEATDARRVFPCMDEPSKKAEFEISIIRLPKYSSLSNMDLLRTETEGPGIPQGWVKDMYKRTLKMSTYLFAVAVSDFEVEEAAPGHYTKPVKVWGPPPYMQAGAGKYSPDLTAKLMTALENYFRVPYTFPKMDKISVPHFGGGAMENWGLNTYRLNRLLIEDGIATESDKISTAITLSHELVHQWFGNLVTLKWWDDLWLNEGFASYYSNTVLIDVGLEDILPLDTLVSDAIQRAMYYDVTSATHPVHYNVTTPTEIRIMFDTITYSKGCAMVRMMEAILTEPVMRDAVTAFLTKFEYNNAQQDDLFQVIDDQATSLPGTDLTMKAVMDTWTLQSGFPVLYVSRTEGSGSITFRQAKFKTDLNNDDDPTPSSWDIPISLYLPTDVQVNTSAVLWLKKDAPIEFFSIANVQWFIINPRQTGYYRVNYNRASIRPIIEQLHTNHEAFDPQTRSALIDDNLNLAYAGYSDLTDALNLTMYLKNERHLVPWTTFVTNMAKPYRFLSRTAGLSAFKKYIVGLIKDTLTEINIDPQPNEPIGNATILRNKLFEWACNLDDSECIQYSKNKFAQWMTDPSNNTIIFPDLRPFVYCAAVANGGDAEWDFALAQYSAANREVTKTNLIRSLACSKSVFRLARFGVSMISSVITTLSNTLNKAYDITDIQRFIRDNEPALQPVNGTLQTAIGNIENNIKWSITLTATPDQPLTVTGVTEDDERDFYIIQLESEIAAGAEVSIQMEYVAQIPTSGAGLFYREYQTETGEVRRLAATQFESVEARRMFPCFDEPDLKAVFELTVIRKDNYTSLANTELVSSTPENLVTLIITHELAHQWFGNLVTLKWWKEVYLNEGLTTYSQYLGMEAVSPDLMGVEFAILDAFQYSMLYDASEYSHPLSNDVTTPDEIDGMFSTISYEKGASVIRMVDGFLTRETLRKGLQAYLKKMSFQGAQQEDLFESLEEAAVADNRLPAGLNMADIMSSWTLQSGFPLVRVQIANETAITVSQERFLNDGAEDPEGSSWFVPITIVTADNPTLENNIPQVWLEKDVSSKAVAHDVSKWIMINQNATEYVSIEAALNLTRYMEQETHFAVWSTFFEHFNNIYVKMASHPGYSLLRDYLVPKLDAALTAVGVEESPSHTGALAILRADLLDWACSLQSPLCFTYANQLLAQWVDNPNTSPILSVDARATLECAIVAAGGKPAFDFVFAKYQDSGSNTELKNEFLNALACTTEISVMNELLNKTLNTTSGIAPGDASSVLNSVSSGALGRTIILDFLSENLEDVITVIGNGGLQPITGVLGTLQNYFTTKAQLDKLEAFVAAHQERLTPINMAIRLVIQRIQDNISWMDTTGFDIWMWLWFSS
ncbi:Aminopeptidase N [Orchesella cincta]|uniref:Aminopeptidase N n=1 Tax=Orchesella cincta TaxID=48709 RepID=A0A1D2N808_ORCCI|nr:Aminopeptidase N [Orchesella cincta]